ncbi:MAG: glycosyltransferase family 2 protein [Pirellula sp.]|jgi:dolichol-phosphate mannosyltransferase|nr:glycosyltransferase family 2 protein [Pirellula sp.]
MTQRSGAGEAIANLQIALVLPVYNEVENLRSLTAKIQQVIDGLPVNSEIIYVNDGSHDGSDKVLDEIASEDDRIRVIHLSRNFGHSAAVRAGIDHSNADAVILMDSDGQDDPLAILRMVDRWLQGAEVVYAVRVARKEGAWKRCLFSMFYRILGKLSSVKIPKDAGNFGLMDRRVVEQIKNLIEVDRYFPGLRSWTGFRQESIQVERLERYDDKPRVGLSGLMSLAKTALFGFSRVPLLAFYGIAFVCAGVSFGLIGFALFHKLFTGLAIPGWTSTTSISAFFGAMNALGIAILGEYVARIYDQVRARPSYIVARVSRGQVDAHRDSYNLLREVAELKQIVMESNGMPNADIPSADIRSVESLQLTSANSNRLT